MCPPSTHPRLYITITKQTRFHKLITAKESAPNGPREGVRCMPGIESMRQMYDHRTIKSKCHVNEVASEQPLATWMYAGCMAMRACHERECTAPENSCRRAVATAPTELFFPGGRRVRSLFWGSQVFVKSELWRSAACSRSRRRSPEAGCRSSSRCDSCARNMSER